MTRNHSIAYILESISGLRCEQFFRKGMCERVFTFTSLV